MDVRVPPPGQGHILVEFVPRAGLQEVARPSPEEIVRRSGQAVDAAMDTVRQMAVRVTESFRTLVDPPSQVEVEFGIKLDVEAGALIAKAATEGSLTIRLTWYRREEQGGDARPQRQVAEPA